MKPFSNYTHCGLCMYRTSNRGTAVPKDTPLKFYRWSAMFSYAMVVCPDRERTYMHSDFAKQYTVLLETRTSTSLDR
jgi:hypothetical protein